MKNSNLIIFDCETGGLDCEKHPITEIALISLDDNFKEINKYKTFIKPYGGLEITKGALEATMLSMADINNGQDYKKTVDILIKFFKQANPNGKSMSAPILAGHNVMFDIGFLTELFKWAGKRLADYVFSNNSIIAYVDTFALGKLAWSFSSKDESSLNLTASAKRVGYKLIDAHGAMNDVVATREVLKFFVDRLRAKTNNDSSTKEAEKKQKTSKFFQF